MMSKVSASSGPPTDLWYPSLITPLLSPNGQETFFQSSHLAYDLLNSHFEPQEHASFCGIACATIVLNTILPHKKWTQSNLYSDVARVHMSNGITLAMLSHVLELCGVSSTIHYFDNDKAEEEFRKDLQEQNQFIIVNYWRQFENKETGYTHRGGHFSLIGAFDKKTDSVLIMDTSHKRFPHHWLLVTQLVRMMLTYDRMAAMPRGYLILNYLP